MKKNINKKYIGKINGKSFLKGFSIGVFGKNIKTKYKGKGKKIFGDKKVFNKLRFIKKKYNLNLFRRKKRRYY